MKYLSRSDKETKEVGRLLAEEVLKTAEGKRAMILGLEGDLGAGKTTFIQGFAGALGIKKITSPTFLIEKQFDLPKGTSPFFRRLYHLDAYRIKEVDLNKLGFKEIVAEPKNIILIEWSDRVQKILPKGTIKLKFAYGRGKEERIITVR